MWYTYSLHCSVKHQALVSCQDAGASVAAADLQLLCLFAMSPVSLDGWAPLCHFLGRPIPEEPFPYTDKFNKERVVVVVLVLVLVLVPVPVPVPVLQLPLLLLLVLLPLVVLLRVMVVIVIGAAAAAAVVVAVVVVV
ncbi:hypothetical protein AK812_SmicGene45534, partial [Symbiodinium microadriaticum]